MTNPQVEHLAEKLVEAAEEDWMTMPDDYDYDGPGRNMYRRLAQWLIDNGAWEVPVISGYLDCDITVPHTISVEDYNKMVAKAKEMLGP